MRDNRLEEIAEELYYEITDSYFIRGFKDEERYRGINIDEEMVTILNSLILRLEELKKDYKR